MKLYKIWHVGAQTYPLEKVLSALTLYRDEVISTDTIKLQLICDRLNCCKDADEYFEIREENDELGMW
jgi:hypothetical protein